MSSSVCDREARPAGASPHSRPRPIVLRAWLPALFWLAVIALESSPMGGVPETSRILLPLLRFLFPQITLPQFELVHAIARKAGHVFGYAVLSLLMFRAWWATLSLPRFAERLPSWRSMLRAWSLKVAVLALFCTTAVAALDEWHQTRIPGRTGTAQDIALDSMAGAFVQLVMVAGSSVGSKRLVIGN